MALTPSKEQSREQKLAERRAAEDEVLMREVDEAVRQGDMEEFGRKWGKPLIGGVILLLAGFGGYLFWESRQEAAMEQQSEALIAAIDNLEAGNLKSADDKLTALIQDGSGGNAAAAIMLRAGIAAEQGKAEDAAKLFDQVAADGGAPPAMRDLAQIRAVVARYDTMKPADVITKLKPLATPGNAYFGSAGELVAHAYLDQGKNAEAGALFAQIANDEKTPELLRSRARQMAGVLGVDVVKDVDALLKEQGVSSDGTAPANATAPAAPQG